MDKEGLVIPQYGRSVADLYHEERNHQGKNNLLLFPAPDKPRRRGTKLACKQRLGGLLRY